MATIRKPAQIPRPDVAPIDPRTGLLQADWYRFFLDLAAKQAEQDARLNALENP